MTALPLDLVDADGRNALRIAVHQAPADGVPHRVADVFPGAVKHRGDFLPTEAPRPAGQEPLIRGRQPALASRPGNAFDHHAARGAIDAPHVKQALRDPLPLVRRCLKRTVANLLSMGFVVRR